MEEGYLMEACVDSVESAVNAERGGWSCEHDSAPSFKVPHGDKDLQFICDVCGWGLQSSWQHNSTTTLSHSDHLQAALHGLSIMQVTLYHADAH